MNLNILFLSLVKVNSIKDRGIYTDLLRELVRQGHHVTAVTPVERRDSSKAVMTIEEGFTNLHVRTLNIQKSNFIEKGIGTLLIGRLFLRAIKHNLPGIKYDIILYSTPPITLYSAVKSLKNSMNATTYLLLKDIFPQNAIDMAMMKNNGLLHKYFKGIETKLYGISDHIGCMSPANVEYIKKYHKEIPLVKLHVNPNSIEPLIISQSREARDEIRSKYDLPLDKRILVYGGNLGIPQGIDFLIEILDQVQVDNTHYLIVGNGSEFNKLHQWTLHNEKEYITLLNFLPKNDYDQLLSSCDIGLILLNKNFLIPNFPSRLLSYLEMGLPVISATDPNTDIGDILELNKCGKKVLAGDIVAFRNSLDKLLFSREVYQDYSDNAIKLLLNDYTVKDSVQIIMNRMKHSKTKQDV